MVLMLVKILFSLKLQSLEVLEWFIVNGKIHFNYGRGFGNVLVNEGCKVLRSSIAKPQLKDHSYQTCIISIMHQKELVFNTFALKQFSRHEQRDETSRRLFV